MITNLRAIEETLKAGHAKGVLYIEKGSGRAKHLVALAQTAGIPVKTRSKEEFAKLVHGSKPKGAALQLNSPLEEAADLPSFLANAPEGDSLVLVLDGVTDPQNYGAIFRSADQFAVDLVVVPQRRTAKETGAAMGVSSGAINYVKRVRVPNLATALEELKEAGYWVYGADMDGESAASIDFKGKIVIVMGREGEGLHRLVRERCDGLVSIPTRGRVDSLNVSVAAGILLYEVRRQQWGG